MKTCSKCKIEKKLTDFHRNKSKKDGLQDCCKLCCKERDKNNRLKFKEKWNRHYKEKSQEKIQWFIR